MFLESIICPRHLNIVPVGVMTKKKFKHPKILRDYWAAVKRCQRFQKKKGIEGDR